MSSAQVMKNINQQMVLSTIYQNKSISRVEISNKVGLTQQTITNIVSRLIKDGVVIESKETSAATNTGRKPIPLKINSSNLFALGIEIGRKRIRGVLMDFAHKILAEMDREIKSFTSGMEAFNMVEETIDQLIAKCPNHRNIKGIGIGVSGIINRNEGIVIKAEPFQWLDFKLKDKLTDKYDYPIYIENDVNMIAVVENAAGLLVNSQNNLTLLLDQGAGGAIVMQKQLHVGSKHVAGEFGAIQAYCGDDKSLQGTSIDSLTTIVSISGLETRLGMSFDQIIARIKEREQHTMAHIQWVGEVLGLALSNLIIFFDPDHVLLTGKLIEGIGYVLVPIIEQTIKQTLTTESHAIIIKNPSPRDSAKDASLLVLKETFEFPVVTYN